MNCTNCIEAKPIPVCSGTLLIGTVAHAQVYVFVQNIATGYIVKHDVTKSIYDSTISIPLSDPYSDFYSPNFYFKLWAANDEAGNDIIPITINTVLYQCFTIIFKPVYTNDLAVKLTNVTLSV